jgi:hypothetical protein
VDLDAEITRWWPLGRQRLVVLDHSDPSGPRPSARAVSRRRRWPEPWKPKDRSAR